MKQVLNKDKMAFKKMPVYRRSCVEAVQRREVQRWEISYSHKIACSMLLSMWLKNKLTKGNTLDSAIKVFGRQTVAFVLANSINRCDERKILPYLKDWAKTQEIPELDDGGEDESGMELENFNQNLIIDCSEKSLESLAVEYLEQSTVSKLLTANHCFPPRTKMNAEGNVLILKEIHLPEEHLTPMHQLWVVLQKDQNRIVARSLMAKVRRELTVNHFYGIAQQSKLPKSVATQLEKDMSTVPTSEIEFWKAQRLGGSLSGFRLLSQVEDIVLLGKLSKTHKLEFSTWIYQQKSEALYSRHFWGDDYEKAKDDFAVRSGLMSEEELIHKGAEA